MTEIKQWGKRIEEKMLVYTNVLKSPIETRISAGPTSVFSID